MTAADLHPDTGLPRPGTCCGVCPPIAGGGWDCTCEGLPGCPAALADAGVGKSAEAAEWDDLARLAQAAQELTPGEWVAGDGWVYTLPVHDDDNRLASVLGMKYADRDRANAEHDRAQRNAEFIAAANPATILRLIAALDKEGTENMNRRDALSFLKEERDALAARLAVVEALAVEWERENLRRPASDGPVTAYLHECAIELRAALSAAPTDTTKETS